MTKSPKCIDPDTGAERCAHVNRVPNPHGGDGRSMGKRAGIEGLAVNV